jgi:hypothetical protein
VYGFLISLKKQNIKVLKFLKLCPLDAVALQRKALISYVLSVCPIISMRLPIIRVDVKFHSGHRVLVGKPEGKRPLGRPRRRWEDNIKKDLQEVGGGCGDWMERAQDRDRWLALVNTVMNFRVP